MKKQSASSIKRNTLKIVVRRVRIAGESRTVKFTARPVRGGVVMCRSRGLPKFRITATEVRGKTVYMARAKNLDGEVSAKSPDRAFARGVKEFWAQ